MDRKTRLFSLIAGCFLLLYGMTKLYEEGDWVIVIIGALIVAFTVSNMVRNRRKEDGGKCP